MRRKRGVLITTRRYLLPNGQLWERLYEDGVEVYEWLVNFSECIAREVERQDAANETPSQHLPEWRRRDNHPTHEDALQMAAAYQRQERDRRTGKVA